MGVSELITGKRGRARFVSLLILCAICVALNVIGAQLAIVLSLPIYLDSVGTILASILGGYIPGIAVGYITNLINTVTDPSAIYYGIINVLIAIITAFVAERGWFKNLPRTLLAVLLVSCVGGILGTLLSYYLNGIGFGDDASSFFGQQLYSSGMLDIVSAQFVAGFLINLVDKTLVMLLATLVYHLLPDEFVARLDFTPWRQTPLSKSEMDATMKTEMSGTSLSAKFVVVAASIMTIVAVAATVFSYVSFHRSMIETESTKAVGITNLMAEAVDSSRISEFVTEGEKAPGYAETEQALADIRDSFDDVEYVYVYQIKEDGCHVVLDPDTADEPGSDPGDVIPFDESFKQYVPALLAGEPIEPVVSNDSYGWLLTVYTPLKNTAGTTVCYLAADISMTHLVSDEMSFIVGNIALFAAFFIFVCAIVLWLGKYSIILPVNSVSRASSSLVLDNESTRTESINQINNLDIQTGDEIENLYKAVSHMSQEAVRYIADAQEKSETIGRMQSNLIMVMADLVESRDKFTGDHVRNTATYARIAMNQMRREGIYPDQLTNEFMSNVYNSAPLHDVGKIVVSDTILNKPGRFTDEEFEIMKRHTIAGKEILESAKGAVSEASYLDEAQRLAAYHHEKWDGSGYPYGLAGEEIPLSARIMAVADVFDALVSKRSYKEGFPIEKAFAIIEGGIGTHFDPYVARAFLHAQDKARAVAEKSNEKKRLEEEAAQKVKEEQEAAEQDAAGDSDAPEQGTT